MEISALYRLDLTLLPGSNKTVAGGDYETIILIPQFRSISRAVTASFSERALFHRRERLGVAIQEELAKKRFPRGE